jgi:hypothetical protein
MVKCGVLFEVRTEFLNIIKTSCGFKGFTYTLVNLGDLVVTVLEIGPKVRGFKPGGGRWNFKSD